MGDNDNAERVHWTERGLAMSVSNSDVTERPRQSVPTLTTILKFLGYSVVVIGFLVGWVGVAIAFRRFWIELLPDEGSNHYNVMADWLMSPGSLVGLPVGIIVAYIIASALRSKGAR